MSNGGITFAKDGWFISLKYRIRTSQTIPKEHNLLTSMETSCCSDFPNRTQVCKIFCFFLELLLLNGNDTEAGEYDRFLAVAEIVRLPREFRPVIDTIVGELTAAAEALRRLRTRRIGISTGGLIGRAGDDELKRGQNSICFSNFIDCYLVDFVRVMIHRLTGEDFLRVVFFLLFIERFKTSFSIDGDIGCSSGVRAL